MKLTADLRDFHAARARRPKPQPTTPDVIVPVLQTGSFSKPTQPDCRYLLLNLTLHQELDIEGAIDEIMEYIRRYQCRECGIVQYTYLNADKIWLQTETQIARRIWNAHKLDECDAPSKIRAQLRQIAITERKIADILRHSEDDDCW